MKQCSEKLEAIRSSCHVISHIGNKELLQIKVDNSRPLRLQFMPMLKDKAFYGSYASTVFMSRYGDRSYLKDLHGLNECSVSEQDEALESIIKGNYDKFHTNHKVLPLGMMRVPLYMIKKSGQEKEQRNVITVYKAARQPGYFS